MERPTQEKTNGELHQISHRTPDYNHNKSNKIFTYGMYSNDNGEELDRNNNFHFLRFFW